MIDNGGVRRVKAGDIRPVLIQVRFQGAGRQASGDIRTAPLKRVDRTDHIGSVKTGDHSVIERKERGAHCPARHGRVETSVFVKAYAPGGVNKSKAKIFGHDLRRQVFAPAGSVIPGRIGPERHLKSLELVVQRKVYTESADDLAESRPDLIKFRLEGFSGRGLLIRIQKKVRHFDVVGKTLSGG